MTGWTAPTSRALNAPRPLVLHYGALDVSGPKNASAAYNETVSHSVAELKAIYKAARVEDNVSLVVSEGLKHEMDNDALLAFLEANAGS